MSKKKSSGTPKMATQAASSPVEAKPNEEKAANQASALSEGSGSQNNDEASNAEADKDNKPANEPQTSPQAQPPVNQQQEDGSLNDPSLYEVTTFGKQDLWVTISSTETKLFRQATSALQLRDGVLVKVSTEHRDVKGRGITVSDAMHYVPGAHVVEEKDEEGTVVGHNLQ